MTKQFEGFGAYGFPFIAVTIFDVVPNQNAIMIFSANQISIAIGAVVGSFMKYMSR